MKNLSFAVRMAQAEANDFKKYIRGNNQSSRKDIEKLKRFK